MNLVNILNTIYDNASSEYQTRIPVATQNNILEIQQAMTNPANAIAVNEFIGTLLNMIALRKIHNKNFENPLKSLKKGSKPLGDTVEEVYANYVQAKGFDPEGRELLTREMPDVKTAYHRMNSQNKYKVTISPQQISKAFLSYQNLESFINTLLSTLTKSHEKDEFIAMKQLIKQAEDNNAIKIVTIDDPLDSKENAGKFLKTIKIISGDMTFPNSNHNAWLEAQNVDNKPIITNSSKKEQVLIIDNATDVSVSMDYLAQIFNMSIADFNDTRKIVIDAFPNPSDRAILCDEQFFQVYEDLLLFKRAENADGLFDNWWLHDWQTFSYSPLVNATVFQVASDEDSDDTIEEFTVTKTLKQGVTSSNKRNKVNEGSSYSTRLIGVKSTDTVTVTMGSTTVEEVTTPTDITETAYDSDTGIITINKVTDNITITVS